jgi:sucrose phosphorylase
VVARLLEMIRLRNQHPAFNGEFALLETEPQRLRMRWSRGDDWAELDADLATCAWQLRANQPGEPGTEYVCAGLEALQRRPA